MDSNITDLYIEKTSAFKKMDHYSDGVETNYLSEVDYWVDPIEKPARLFWNRNMQRDPFTTQSFYYAEFNHPKLGKAIFGTQNNQGYVWRFINESDLKKALKWVIGDIYTDMLHDGYIVIKKGHYSITPD